MSDIAKSVAIAEQVAAKADAAVADLRIEMTLRKWPAEFRAIMWDAVAIVAQNLAKEAREVASPSPSTGRR